MAAKKPGKTILAFLGGGGDEEEMPKRKPRDPMEDSEDEAPMGDEEEGDEGEAEEAGVALADALESRDGKAIAEAFARLLEAV